MIERDDWANALFISYGRMLLRFSAVRTLCFAYIFKIFFLQNYFVISKKKCVCVLRWRSDCEQLKE